MSELTAIVRGLPQYPNIVEINVREGPGTNYNNPFKAAVGLEGLPVSDVQADNEGKNLDGKVYQWFHVTFPDNRTGWIRDDLLEIIGDGTPFGYPNMTEKCFAFAMARQAVASTEAASAEEPASEPETQSAPAGGSSGAVVQDMARVQAASYAITAAFEGGSYKAYNNYDAGIVSYGLFQFTLAAGSLGAVLERYLSSSQTPEAEKLRGYLPRVQGRDPNLRYDMGFKDALLAAGDDPAMQEAQRQIGTEKYWNAVYNGYIVPRGLKTPLAYALLFDMGINFGTGHGFVRWAEEKLGVPPRSRPGENGITEEQLIAKVAELRKLSHDKQAARDNLPGLKVRGDFWVDLVNKGDWGLQGDANGFVNVGGRMIQVKNPA